MNSFNFVLLVVALTIGAHASVKEKLIGAEVAEIGEFPYQVSLRFENKHYCGGAIITKRHVLTAAHCVSSIKQSLKPKEFVTVVAGTNSLTSGGKSYEVEAVSYYDKYQDQTLVPDYMHDIGVVTLAEEIEETRLIKIIGLSTTEVTEGQEAMIAGWGSTSPGSPASTNLRKLNVKVVSNSKCQRYFYSFRENVEAHPRSHLCAYKEHGTGVCSGDSGGPLVSGGKIIGVLSGGDCGRGLPDVYTRVQFYLDYIHKIINETRK